jgi:DNA polymerase
MILEKDKQLLLSTLRSLKSLGIEYIEEFEYKNLYSQNSNEKLPNTINELNDIVEHCSLCELSKLTSKKNMGIGNPTSEIYMIDEQYQSKNKNLSNLMEQILHNLGLSLQEIYITNIIKCSIDLPLGEKTQYGESCKDFIYKQLDIQKPKIIITFGKSWEYFLDIAQNETVNYGLQYQYKNSVLFPFYDLEFLYKNPSYYDEMMQTINKIKRYIHSE